MSKDYKTVSVTHFINPHLFWYHYGPNKSLIQLEKQLQQILKEKQMKPAIGTLVAVKYLPRGELIRARVDHIKPKKEKLGSQIILWAIDHGFPFSTKADNIFRLPEELTKVIKHVCRGGLVDTFPAERNFESKFEFWRAQTTQCRNWSNNACIKMGQLVKEAKKIEVMEHFSTNNHSWVELRLTNELGVKFNIRDYLMEMYFATESERNFIEICPHLDTTKIEPWKTNEGQNIVIASKKSQNAEKIAETRANSSIPVTDTTRTQQDNSNIAVSGAHLTSKKRSSSQSAGDSTAESAIQVDGNRTDGAAVKKLKCDPQAVYKNRLLCKYQEGDIIDGEICNIKALQFNLIDQKNDVMSRIKKLSSSGDLRPYQGIPKKFEIFGLRVDGRVMRVISKSVPARNSKVYLMDSPGTSTMTEADLIYHLPEDIQVIPSKSVRCLLMGINGRKTARNEELHRWLEDSQEKGAKFIVKEIYPDHLRLEIIISHEENSNEF